VSCQFISWGDLSFFLPHFQKNAKKTTLFTVVYGEVVSKNRINFVGVFSVFSVDLGANGVGFSRVLTIFARDARGGGEYIGLDS